MLFIAYLMVLFSKPIGDYNQDGTSPQLIAKHLKEKFSE